MSFTMEINQDIHMTYPQNTTFLNAYTPVDHDSAVNVTPFSLHNQTLSESSTSLSFTDIFYYVVGAIGVVDNGLVIFIMIANKSMRQRINNVLITNLSILDWLTCFFFLVNPPTGDLTVPYTGLAAEIYCRLWHTNWLWWWPMVSSIFGLSAITIERYFAIIYPLKYKVLFTYKICFIICFITWFIPMSYIGIWCITLSDMVNGECIILKWPP